VIRSGSSPTRVYILVTRHVVVRPSSDMFQPANCARAIQRYKHADGHHTYMAMFDRWNAGRPGPSGIDNMTMLWLPLIPPKSSGPQPPRVGTALIVDTCNASAPEQAWRFDGGKLVNVESSLCVSDGGRGDAVTLQPCSDSDGSSWEPTPEGAVSNGESGSACMMLNVLDDVPHAPGNPVVSYVAPSHSLDSHTHTRTRAHTHTHTHTHRHKHTHTHTHTLALFTACTHESRRRVRCIDAFDAFIRCLHRLVGSCFRIPSSRLPTTCSLTELAFDYAHAIIDRYDCARPPQWNDIWSLPTADASGPLVAHDKDGKVSSLCLSAPGSTGGDWTMPYLPAWSLKDF
jgi:hypothetical protein